MSPAATGWQVGVTAGPVDLSISHPSLIPDIGIELTPQLEPGSSGWLRMNMTNRYPVPMTNVTLVLEIFEALNEKEKKEIDRVSHPPTFREAEEPVGATSSIDGLTASIHESYIASNRTRPYALRIGSSKDTYQATYVIRMELRFQYEGGQNVLMRSKGHFSNREWEEATNGDNPDDTGNVNITALGVDGIIPDTSFGVRKPFPQWPRYVFLGLAVVSLGLGIFFYQVEEKGKFPAAKERLDRIEKRFRELRPRLRR